MVNQHTAKAMSEWAITGDFDSSVDSAYELTEFINKLVEKALNGEDLP